MKRWSFDLLVIAGIFLAYAITIKLAMPLDYPGTLLCAAANTVPVAIFGSIVRRIILRKLLGKPAPLQLAAHLLMCAVFAALSYVLLIVLLGLFTGGGPAGFLVKPFSPSGAAWQSLENVTTYALVAAISYLQASAPGPPLIEAAAGGPVAAPHADAFIATPPSDTATKEADSKADASPSRYFVRIGDELRPLDIDTVVSIGGADDYAEVSTLTGKHLVRITLAEFGKSLDPARYVRVHRSWIVNVHRVARAEPAGGGRLLLHMETGQVIATSRTGARLMRDRVI